MRHLVGFFDSGIGGISVLTCAKSHMSNCDFIYYADTDNVPYGTKTKEQILNYCRTAFDFFASQKVDAVVIACNTATSMAVEEMRKEYHFPIVGMEPALRPAFMNKDNSKILVTATPATISGNKLHKLIDDLGADPSLVALPELVLLAEKSDFSKKSAIKYLSQMIASPEQYDAVVLGCTHFTYFRDSFGEYFKNAEIIDGNIGTVKHLCSVLNLDYDETSEFSSNVTYYCSGRIITDQNLLAHFNELSQRYINLNI